MKGCVKYRQIWSSNETYASDVKRAVLHAHINGAQSSLTNVISMTH